MIPRLSESTQELLRKFYASRGVFDVFFQRDNRKDILKQIEASGEVAAIPALLHIFVNENRELQYAAARAMYTLFQELAPGDFTDFDEAIRGSSWSYWNYGQSTLQAPKNIRSLTIFADYSNFLLGIFACHANGYTRESAVRALDDCHTGEELPFFLLRANDWVENVRTIALEILHKRIREEYIPHFLKFLPLVLRLSRAGRLNHQATVERIQNVFTLPSASPHIERGLNSEDAVIRRFCYGVALRTGDSNRLLEIARRALEDEDIRISLDAMKALSLAPASSDFRALIEPVFQSKTPQLRRTALRLTIEKYPGSASEECRKALLDRNRGVRQMAQFFLAKEGKPALCDFYKQALAKATSKTLPTVIAGVGETCAAENAELIAPFANSNRSELRAKALQSIAQLAPNYSAEPFLFALEDQSARLARTAALVLQKKATRIGGERLWTIYAKTKNPRCRRWTLFLISRLLKWDSISLLILALADQDENVAELARKYVVRWLARYNLSFIRPSREQVDKLRATLQEHELLLSKKTYEQLSFLVRGW